MSNCSRCSKIISSKKYCSHCNSLFCSDFCLKHHINISHLNELYNKQSNDNNINNNNVLISANNSLISENNNSDNKYKKSPFITKGTMTLGKVIYDETFSLKNFKPVLENGKDKIIGTGAYGKVFLAINKYDKKCYAIKHMIKKDLYKALKTLKGIYTEIDIQSRINHPNIIRLLYVKERSESFDLVMEFAKYGNLYSYIKKHSYLTEDKSFKFFIQVVNAIYFLHKNDLIHRDIKPENILLFEDCVKLCDFGWCARLDGGNRGTFCGTAEYMSPEMVNKEEYSKDIDIWSLGILLYEMIHGHSPFKPNKAKFNINDIIDNIKIKDLKFNENITKECKELIIHLLDRDVTKRYKIEDIFNSNFVKYYENYYKMKKSSLTTRKTEINNNKKNNTNKNCETLDNNFVYTKHIISNNNQLLIDKNNTKNKDEFQKMKCKIKNKTARNFYPSNLNKKEKEKDNSINIEDSNKNNNIMNNNNLITSKYSSYSKVKKTENKFDSARYISQDNLLNYFNKPKNNNVKEKHQINNNTISTPNLIKNDTNNNNVNLKQDLTLKKNKYNQSLTQRTKFSTQTAKNKNVSLNDNNNTTKQLYTNRSKNTNKIKARLNSCENYPKKISMKSSECLFNNYEENKTPLITDINDDTINNNKENTINTRIKQNKKVKIKTGINSINNNINNNEEIKIITDNYINANTGKIKTKVKNYYRSKTNLIEDNNRSPNPQINIINNNHIYNNNIVKYSFFSNGRKNVKVKDNSILTYHKSANNNGIILLMNKDKKNGVYPIKTQINKDNNEEEENPIIEDLDETPKKDIDVVKITPNELINNFNKELEHFLKNE
jgi:serine/threonine protein kinase